MNVAFNHGGARILQGNALDVLAELPADYYHAVITSPPYWGLRSYCKADSAEKAYELGSEPDPASYIAAQVAVFRECRRVLHPTGVLVVNIGDTYAGGPMGGYSSKQASNKGSVTQPILQHPPDCQPGEPVGIPDMLKNALRADGWRHRDTVIWAKPAPMPASLAGWRWERCKVHVTKAPGGKGLKIGQLGQRCAGSLSSDDDRPTWSDCPGCPKCLPHGGYVLRKGQWRTTTAHEVCFMFVKSDRYFCDAAGVKEPATGATIARNKYSRVIDDPDEQYAVAHDHEFTGATRNPRSVRTWGPEPCKFSHYAAFPSALPRFFIKAATSPKGCCPTCGIPYSPVVERGELVPDAPGYYPRGSASDDGLVHNAMTPAGTSQGHPNHHYENKCLGYRQSCDCPPLPSVPCRVLDPYAGTATTLQAALELGCEADGIELNPQYVGYAIERLSAYLVPKGPAPSEAGLKVEGGTAGGDAAEAGECPIV
jgi:DNA modification methylase